VKPKAELLTPAVKRAERQLIRMLFEAEEFREKLAREITSDDLQRGLETVKIFESLFAAITKNEKLDAAALSASLEEKDRRLLFEILFESLPEATWDDAASCLDFLRSRQVEQELAELQKQLEAKPSADELRRIVTRRLELQKLLASH
jgi:hypothetical protein